MGGEPRNGCSLGKTRHEADDIGGRRIPDAIVPLTDKANPVWHDERPCVGANPNLLRGVAVGRREKMNTVEFARWQCNALAAG